MGRSYGIADCPVARTLDSIGERWTVLLLDLLLHGSRRFQDFQISLPGLAPNTLSARLKAMEDDGLVERVLYSERPPRLAYALTEKGMSLGPVVRSMRDWGLKQLQKSCRSHGTVAPSDATEVAHPQISLTRKR